MLHKIFCRITLCLTMLAFSSCSAPANPDPNDAPQAEQAEVDQVQSQQTSKISPDVLVRYGDKMLTMEQARWMQPSSDSRKTEEFANWWIENELLYEEALRRGITDQPKAKFIAEALKKRAFAQVLRRQVTQEVEVSDAEAMAHYEKRKVSDLKLMEPGSLSFSHIRTEGLKDAEAALQRIKAGEDINELAKELSTYSDAQKGGVVDKQPYNTVRRFFGTPFFETLLTAKEGDLIGPAHIRGDTYEIAIFKSRVEPKTLPFDEVKEQIKSKLKRNKASAAYNELLDSLKKAASDKIVRSPLINNPQPPAPPVKNIKPK